LTLKGKASLEKTLQSIRDALPPEFKNQLQDGLQIDAQAQERVQREIQNLLQQPLEFQTASEQLTPESQQRLNAIATQLTQVPDAEITISGHTDNAGQIQANQKLSQARADSVRDYLVQMGLPAAKMHTLAFGDSQPIADNQTAAGRARNRRIEFKLQ
jgi:OOP family OmpA-OmpF porin